MPARSVSARIDVDTERAMAASAAETHSTVSRAPPLFASYFIRRPWRSATGFAQSFRVDQRKRSDNAVLGKRRGDGDHGQPDGIGRGRSHFDANGRRQNWAAPFVHPAASAKLRVRIHLEIGDPAVGQAGGGDKGLRRSLQRRRSRRKTRPCSPGRCRGAHTRSTSRFRLHPARLDIRRCAAPRARLRRSNTCSPSGVPWTCRERRRDSTAPAHPVRAGIAPPSCRERIRWTPSARRFSSRRVWVRLSDSRPPRIAISMPVAIAATSVMEIISSINVKPRCDLEVTRCPLPAAKAPGGSLREKNCGAWCHPSTRFRARCGRSPS